MGQCDLCGGNAGVFKNRHSACDTKAESLKQSLESFVVEGIKAGQRIGELNSDVEAKIQENNLPVLHFKPIMLQAANSAVMQIAQESPISQDELARLIDILGGFGFPEGNRDRILRDRLYGMAFAFMSNVLHEVQNGRLPYFDGQGQSQFNLRQGEQPIFHAGKVTFAEERTVSTGRGYGGLSIPIGAGSYYHVGTSQEEKVSGLLPIDVGEMLIASRSLYFGGQKRTMRISLASVLRYQPYIDGVGICEPAGPPKVFVPDYSGMDTGWFFFNLLSTLTSRL